MPVLVEAVSAPSAQDLADLAKIYADAPDWLLAPHASGQALIETALAESRLIAARFNDRLLGAALLARDETAWRLSHLCVRKVTRRRGVARRLIEDTQRRAALAGCALHLAAPPGPAEPAILAARLHLTLDGLPSG